MRTLARWMMVAAAVALLGGSAFAQRQPGGGGGTGGGQFDTSRFALGSGLKSQLVSNKDLAEEIKLTDDQKDKIKKFADKAAESMGLGGGGGGGGRPGGGGGGGGGGGFGGFGGFGAAQSDEEQIDSLKKQITRIEERMKFFKETLTADQVKRLAQLEIQQQGMRAFSSEKIAKDLKLTDEQKESIKKIDADYQKESGDLRKEYGLGGGGFGGGGGGGGGQRPDADKMAEYQKKAKVLREEAQEKIEKGLTADQKKIWTDLIGTPFDTSKLNQGFGGFGGGGGGGGRPGGGNTAGGAGGDTGGTTPAQPNTQRGQRGQRGGNTRPGGGN